MHCLVIAGGVADDLPADGKSLGRSDVIVCADGGVHNAHRLGLQPDVVIGDLDSLGDEEREQLQTAGCRFFVHPAEKNETDLELALLWCVQAGISTATVIGALGGRPDHAVANLLLLTDPRFATMQLCLRSREWEVWPVRSEVTITGLAGDTVSLIPISAAVDGIHTQGLAYPLHGESLLRGPARGVSNVMLNTVAHLHIESGLLLVMHGPPQN